MSIHAQPSAALLRFPARLRLVSDNRRLSDPRAAQPPSALDALLSAGAIDDRQHAAGLAYAALRRRYEQSGGWHGIPHEAWAAVKRDHAALIRAAGAERFVLDRLVLDDEEPLRCEVERVVEALARLTRIMPSRSLPLFRNSKSNQVPELSPNRTR